MAGTGDLKIDFVLTLELHFAVVEAAREEHVAVYADQGVTVETVILRGFHPGHFDASLYRHSVCPRVGMERFWPRVPIIPEVADQWTIGPLVDVQNGGTRPNPQIASRFRRIPRRLA